MDDPFGPSIFALIALILAASKDRFGSTETSKSVCLSPTRRSRLDMATSRFECLRPYTPKPAPETVEFVAELWYRGTGGRAWRTVWSTRAACRPMDIVQSHSVPANGGHARILENRKETNHVNDVMKDYIKSMCALFGTFRKSLFMAANDKDEAFSDDERKVYQTMDEMTDRYLVDMEKLIDE